MIVVNPTGGGLSGGKLAQATATPADVLSGKTFFAGGREMQTGALVPTGKTASGSAEVPNEDNASIFINCGFTPLLVVVRNSLSDNPVYGYNILSYSYKSGSSNDSTLIVCDAYRSLIGSSMAIIGANGFTLYNQNVYGVGTIAEYGPFYYFAVG